jgi:hypothetical protein
MVRQEKLGFRVLSLATVGSEGAAAQDIIGGEEMPVTGVLRVGATETMVLASVALVAASFIAMSWMKNPSRSGGG